MFKRFIVIFCVAAFAVNLCVNASALSVSASSAILLDANSGEILYESNAYEQLSMASTTKIMTALLTTEYIQTNGDQTVEITEEMVLVEGSSMGLKQGDKISLSVLVVGMLLPSGNDAATSAAIYIGGSLENFAVIMNEKATEIGMTNTNFVTPSGLDDDNHYTTAYDMAVLTAYSVNNEDFSLVFSSYQMTVSYFSAESQSNIAVTYTNHNQLLESYEFCTGGKTGYTSKSGRCLVTTAEKDGCSLVAVTLNDPNDWEDHVTLMEYGFSLIKEFVFMSYELEIPKAEGGEMRILIFDKTIKYITASDIQRVVCLPRFIYAENLNYGDEIGTVKYYIDGELLGQYPIIY
ncbi:MAG: D-alanyl-D-alanine carboxypeptidase family protein [Clostridia bacterium]